VLKKRLKWIGLILGSLIGLLVLVLVGLYFVGTEKVNKTYDVPVETISIPTDTATVQRGQHLATILICTRCHVENMAGKVDFAIPGMLTIPTPNLTTGTGGVGSVYTDADWVRAIRHGVGHDGRALFIMPSKSYYYLGDEDLGAIIAYLKSLPPVDNELPERRIELLGRLMDGAGMFPPDAVEQIDHTGPRPVAPEPGMTAAYGEYLARTCTECHGANLNGIPFGPPGEEVPSPNLTPGGKLAAWSEEDFFSTIRTGVTPEGRQLNIDMPWMYYARMSDEELRALWLYLQSLPALAQGG
jgi:mono/diheme cytochrome c family protein